jgi:hypothetical protein
VVEALRERGVEPEAAETEIGDELDGLTFVFTGSLDGYTRSDAQDLVERHGGNATSSVSGNTDYLVAGADPGASKRDDAEANEVPSSTSRNSRNSSRSTASIRRRDLIGRAGESSGTRGDGPHASRDPVDSGPRSGPRAPPARPAVARQVMGTLFPVRYLNIRRRRMRYISINIELSHQ